MATNKRKENFISKIVKDPANPPKTILLRGYLGDSSEAGHTRLYLDAQLNSYVEVPDDAILHEEELPGTPQGETYVWIKQDAQVIHGEAGPQRRKASFFEGPIAEAARPQFTPAFGCLPPPPRTPAFGCPVTDQFFGCQTPVEPCELQTARCPLPTPRLACPTHQLHGCITPVRPCELETALCPAPSLVCPITHHLHACQTPVRPCVVESALCPVTHQLHGCLTQVRPCVAEVRDWPPRPSVDFRCPTPDFGCPIPAPLTPLRGCPITYNYFGCPPPLTPQFACPVTQSRIVCPPPPMTPLRGCEPTLELNCQQTPFVNCPPTQLRGCDFTLDFNCQQTPLCPQPTRVCF